jgi:hypothetical protein
VVTGYRLVALGAVLVGVAAAPASGSVANPQKPRIRVTFIGDSVPAAIDYVALARRQLARGIAVRLDLRVCRRLATLSCPYQGVTPPSALEDVEALGSRIGDVLVIDVGYNETASTYRSGMAQIIRTAVRHGVRGIVWVTLRETRGIYHWTNIVIRSEAKKRPRVYVADWNAYSAGKPWFADDGLHLNSLGAEGLVALVRPYVFLAARTRPEH